MSDSPVTFSDDLPFLTADLPGVGGSIKRFDEDFVVEEIPRYPACGDGTHVYFRIEKRGLTTPAAIGLVARRLGVKPRDIGYAGLKDAHGVTRQTLSVEHVDPGRVESLDLERIKILSVTRHTNKIKLGHLAGNRFEVRLRDCAADALDRVEAVMKVLTQRGVPNYFGPQRFGARGDNAVVGLAVLRGDFDEAVSFVLGRPQPFEREDIQEARRLFDAGDYRGAGASWPRRVADMAKLCRVMDDSGGDAQKVWRAVQNHQRKFYYSALQSLLFNRVVAIRVQQIDRLIDGDIAWIHRNGACFQVEDVEVEQPRCASFEISPSGPLFGKNMKTPSGAAAQTEHAALEQAGLASLQVASLEKARLDGARRPLRVPLADPSVMTGKDDRAEFTQLTFTLPPGAYATVVAREVIKTKPDATGRSSS